MNKQFLILAYVTFLLWILLFSGIGKKSFADLGASLHLPEQPPPAPRLTDENLYPENLAKN